MAIRMTTTPSKRFDEKTNEIKRRPPVKPSTDPNHIYITRKTNIESQVKSAETVLNNSFDEVFIHGLGASINKALVFALELERRFGGSVQSDIQTSTVQCTDDIVSLGELEQTETRHRYISAVHVHLYRAAS
uniref:Ribonuclease P protein subunit p20 n=1 Tax=Caenorhabditis tropicalis TaxID=1561998 RepID=A0A1I7TE44_9PELO